MRSGDDRARRARVAAIVCTATGFAAMIAAPLARSATAGSRAETAPAAPSAVAASVGEEPVRAEAAQPESPSWVEADGAVGKAFVYPPASPSDDPRPVTVLLHGMCGSPQGACAPFADVSTARGWLVCPRGENVCGGGGASWRLNGEDDTRLIESSLRSLARAHEGEIDASSPRVLVGFSLGGIAAMQVLAKGGARYAGLVIIASQIHPDAASLARAGVKRAVFAAGDYDMTSAPLQEDARRLDRAGLPTRFVSLGKFGHGYPPDIEQRMREPMQWVGGG
jgi:predicted esterase